MNTYNRAQGMTNRLNMLFNQELENEAQYIKSHPFSSINMSLVGTAALACTPLLLIAPTSPTPLSSAALHTADGRPSVVEEAPQPLNPKPQIQTLTL